MNTPNQKLAESLKQLHQLQQGKRSVFKSSDFSRTDRERLLKHGFLQEVTSGWLIAANPDTQPGDTTGWFASFWEFCQCYANERFGDTWYLSPEQSLLLHAEHTIIPQQVIIYTPKGNNNNRSLLFGTSLYDLKQSYPPDEQDLVTHEGLKLYTITAALIRVSAGFYQEHPIEAQIILRMVDNQPQLLRKLLEGGHSTIAGRLAGAYRHIGKHAIADTIIKTMQAADFNPRENNPFKEQKALSITGKDTLPIVTRMHAAWQTMRETVIDSFATIPRHNMKKHALLKHMDSLYQQDAYHSLSIEGYRVSPTLIDRVHSGQWNPEENYMDRENHDALAARGYWQAFELVKQTVDATFTETSAAHLIRQQHNDWYQALFQPHVATGMLDRSLLAGYRNDAVYLRTSRHVPPRWQILPDAMSCLFDLLEQETEPAVSAVIGHWLLGYIHPYPDGNGRMARFLMNVMFVWGGYPWITIKVEDRQDYLEALEAASLDMNITPFAEFLAHYIKKLEIGE